MISLVEFVHSKSLILGDVKISNFLMGSGRHAGEVCAIDFGCAKKYIDDTTHLHISYSKTKMAQSVSSLSLSLPSSNVTKSANVVPNSMCYGFPCFPKQGSCYRPIKVKAMASGESRDNLDHLQRARVQQNQQPQPRRRVAQVAPLGLWDRFPNAKTVQQMMDTMERLMEDPFAYNNTDNQLWAVSPQLQNEPNNYNKGRTPWEIKESETEYRMRFDMPGMTKDDVKLYVEDKMLVVKAEKVTEISKDGEGEQKEGDESKAEQWFGKSCGKYFSRIALPENVEFEKINAQVKDGVLYITIPKVVGAGNKILDINVQ